MNALSETSTTANSGKRIALSQIHETPDHSCSMPSPADTTSVSLAPLTRITLDTMIPDLLGACPQARAVLDRYGLSGCGGRLGPVETLGFFAKSHGVDPATLLEQLHVASATPDAPSPAFAPTIADTIYRRFFLGGIAIILTAGAVWGAWLLWQIGILGKFTGVTIHHVNAHGHAQIYGWVGLFIMGFACQAFPRIWHTTLAAPRWAVAAFVLMMLGLIVRTIGMTASGSSGSLATAMAGGTAEILAVLIFAVQILVTFRRSKAAFEPYVAFAVGAIFFFVAQSFMDVWHTWATMTAPTRERLLWHVATYQAPLRDLQIHGLALFMILGVSIRMLPALFDVPKTTDRRAWKALAVLAIAVLGETVLFIAYRWTGKHALAAFLMVPWLMLAAGCIMIAWPWRLWRPFAVSDRSGKFIRAAYAWLAISLIMLLLLPVYQAASGIAFSHAYYGAIRHAITVGFISLMIMGFAAKVVPTLNGVDPRSLTGLTGPFLLINLGCFLRVSLQTLTDWNPAFFKFVGISGTLEVIALAWWGGHLARIIWAGRNATLADEAPAQSKPAQLSAEHRVTDILRWFPQTAPVFVQNGFGLLMNPIARATVARGVTVAQASRFKGVDADQLLNELNAAIEDLPERPAVFH